jgi:hypothetical protein
MKSFIFCIETFLSGLKMFQPGSGYKETQLQPEKKPETLGENLKFKFDLMGEKKFENAALNYHTLWNRCA